jgi:hypothetical protein
MSRYSLVGSAAECEPGSNGLVLRNRLGIKDPAVMEILERDLLLDGRSDRLASAMAEFCLCVVRKSAVVQSE